MRRPTRTQALRRRATAVALGALAAAGALALATGDGGGDDGTVVVAPTAAPASVAPGAGSAGGTTSTTTPTGRFVPAPGEGVVAGDGPLTTYRVEVEDGSGVDVEDVGAEVEAILSDPRGWTTAEEIALQRVPGDADLVVTLATPPTVDLLCFPLTTDGVVSCAQDGRAVLNLDRWQRGAEPSGLDLAGYRRYLVSHEVGHLLGHGHVECPGPGRPAPVMMQQTLTIGDCVPNPWPVPPEQATG